jgi:uncharacterized protein YjbJ (UPF0337 family)
MDWNRVEGNWKQLKGKVKEKWGNLTDDDRTAINGRRDQLGANSNSATASRRIRSEKTLTIGTTPRVGKHSLHLKATSAPLRRGLFYRLADLVHP